MSAHPGSRARRAALTLVVSLSLALAACARNAPQDSLDPQGTNARKIDDIFVPVFWIAAVVFVLVQGMVLVFTFRYRVRRGESVDEVGEGSPEGRGPRPKNLEPVQVHGNSRLELGWTIAPALLLLGVAVFTIPLIFNLAREGGSDRLNVDVTAKQFWWEYRYTDAGTDFSTANELHIPAGRDVRLTLRGTDVIHSFWVPELAGTVDVVPGRVNRLTIKSDDPGTYLGQCKEFCGLSHANMRLRVIVDPPADFQRWVADQRSPETPILASGSQAATGRELFETKGCTGCHTVNGFSQGNVGPNLTHVYGRQTFAGAMFDMNVGNLHRWLKNPPGVKPGSKMPNLNLSDVEVNDLVAYLQTLR